MIAFMRLEERAFTSSNFLNQKMAACKPDTFCLWLHYLDLHAHWPQGLALSWMLKVIA